MGVIAGNRHTSTHPFLTSASGEPFKVVAVTPASLPFSASAAELIGISFKSLPQQKTQKQQILSSYCLITYHYNIFHCFCLGSTAFTTVLSPTVTSNV
ncbi:MAG: hypothetical protein IPM85_00255 [Chitinophagaceae bacterium]|nr:hypothetical protein [Chitinophagaceae bacterium]